MLGQSMYALSAPCPMLHDHSEMNVAHDTMDHSHTNHDTMMDHTITEPSMSMDCCGDEICPMNGCASAVLIQADVLASAIQTDHLKVNSYSSHYLSVQTNSLYRPPISL